MFALSRWSGGLLARVGRRLPLTIGPAIAAIGLAIFAVSPADGRFVVSVLPGILVLGIGMAITVAPLTTTVMDSVDGAHSGVASGVNNAVARVAGLIAIAIFGVFSSRSFESRVRPEVERLALPANARAAVDRELPKMAGAELDSIPSLAPDRRAAVRSAVDQSFAGVFRLSLLGCAALAVAAAIAGFLIA
jgi:hypothetical protein